MEKTRDLFKKIRDIMGMFHAKMGTIKDRNGMDRNRSRRDKEQRIPNTRITFVKSEDNIWTTTRNSPLDSG